MTECAHVLLTTSFKLCEVHTSLSLMTPGPSLSWLIWHLPWLELEAGLSHQRHDPGVPWLEPAGRNNPMSGLCKESSSSILHRKAHNRDENFHFFCVLILRIKFRLLPIKLAVDRNFQVVHILFSQFLIICAVRNSGTSPVNPMNGTQPVSGFTLAALAAATQQATKGGPPLLSAVGWICKTMEKTKT